MKISRCDRVLRRITVLLGLLMYFCCGRLQPAAAQSVPPGSGIASFQVRPGFRIELVAAEPLVEAPVALAFDERGRLFVAEIPGYPNRRPENANNGRIRLLKDRGNHGVYTKSSIYAEGLSWPSAVACFGGGVFVAASSEILYLKDRQTNDEADVNEVVFTGFGAFKNAATADDVLNSFQWGLDNRIHGVTAGIGGVVSSVGGAIAGPVSLENSDFSFDPKTREIFPEATPAQSGLTFDESGRRFTSDLDRPLMLLMYRRGYFSRNPLFPKPPEIINVCSPAVTIYPLVKAGQAPGRAAQPGQRAAAAAWMTSARSCLIYRGDAFPAEYRGNVFIADPNAHVIHREVLGEQGLAVRAERSPSPVHTEFVVSSDPGFHPMQIAEGPDGALYVADRREGAGGRIYRIVPTTLNAPRLAKVGRATTYELVAALASPDGWQQDTASRLLYERQDRAAIPLLARMLEGARLPLARLRALHALDGLGALNERLLLTALGDADERVREHAVLLADGTVSNGTISDALWQQLKTMGADPSLRVRYQLAFAAGDIQRPESASLLAALLRRDIDNPWMRAAVQSSLARNAMDVFLILVGDSQFRRGDSGFDMLCQLARMIGLMNQAGSTGGIIEYFAGSNLEVGALARLIAAFGRGLHQAGSTLAQADPQQRLQPFLQQAAMKVITGGYDDAQTIANIQLLSQGPYIPWNGIDWPFTVLASRQNEPVQAEAIVAMRYSPDPGFVTNLLVRLPQLSPRLRQEAVATLLAHDDEVNFALGALERGVIRRNEVSPQDINFLRTDSDPAIRHRALQLFGPLTPGRPEAVVPFQPALSLNGSAEHGRQIFSARCSACHQIQGDFPMLGPNLAGVKVKGRERLLEDIIEPNLNVRRGYQTSVVRTKEAENLIGIVTDESLTTVTLAQTDGDRSVWPRDNIQSIQPQSWSLMPEGLESGLTTQDIADLLEYLMTAE